MIAPNPAQPPTWRAWKARTWRAWKARTGRRWWRYPLAVEWALEWFVYRLRGLALFDLFELAGKLTVLVAVVIWFLEADDRTKERHYRAWELINSARGSTGDGGRRDALQDLNKDGVSLAAAPLGQAHLPGVELKDADLPEADLQKAILRGANLQEADLRGANLQEADLGRVLDTSSWIAEGIQIIRGVSQGTPSTERERHTNLRGVNLRGANLDGANLDGANLQNANLRDANLRKADLQNTDFQGVRDLTQEQLDEANGNDRTVLPDGLARPAHWWRITKAPEVPPPAQPDSAERAPVTRGAPGPDK